MSPRIRLASFGMMLVFVVAGLATAGCWAFPSLPFVPGTAYAGELDCSGVAVAPNGAQDTIEFSHSIVLAVDERGDFLLDDVDLMVGEEVVRSIGTADLIFEIMQVIRIGPLITVRLAPRPTLPGITVTGDLLETYRWTAGVIPAGLVEAATAADLVIEGADGTTVLSVECAGELSPNQP